MKSLLILLFFVSLWGNEKVSLQLLWKHQFEFAGFYMAKEKGFYRDVGLDVTLKEFDPSVHAVQDVLTQKVDFGIEYASLILHRLRGEKVVVLNAIYQDSPYVLVAKKRKDLTSVKDFKNKKIMLSDNAESLVAITSMMKINSITDSDFTKVKHTFNLDAFLDDEVDLVTIYTSNELYELQKKGVSYRIFDPKEFGIHFYTDFLFTSQSYLDKHPQSVEKFQKASLRGWKYAFSHIDETIDVILKYYNTQNKSREALLFEAQTLQKLAFAKGVEFGDVNPSRVAQTANMYRIFSMARKSNEALKGFIYHKYSLVESIEAMFTMKNISFVLIAIAIILFLIMYKQTLLKHENDKLENLVEEVKRQKEALQAIYQHSKDAIGILDMSSNFTDVNPAYLEMTGYTREELLQTSCINLTVESDIEKSKVAMAEVKKKGFIQNFEKECKIKNNKTIFVNMSMSFLHNPDRILINVRNISKQKEIEEKLLEAKVKAESANLEKSTFLANMSHEIRTPMNGIIGIGHLLLQTKLDAKQKNYMQKIDGSAKLLLGIINDILDLSKIEAKKMELEKIDFDVKNVIDSIENLLLYKAQEKGLIFEISCAEGVEERLHGDPLRLSQIVINLANNAIKFTEKGFVKIRISQENNLYRCEVSDSGIGISKEQQEKLFKAFSQADVSTTRKYGGTGLGLNISKHLVELMHGHIWVESEEGKGSTFGFEIPLEKAKGDFKKEDIVCTLEDLKVLAGKKVLLVEDNKTNQFLIDGLLEDSGIFLEFANNGQEALEKFQKSEYDLILMDLQMPVMNGYEATVAIREVDVEIPIVALTANAMLEDMQQTKEVGMNGHIAKPINVDKFYAILLEFLA